MAPWLAWLLPVPLATVGAILWANWSARARGPEEAIDSVAQYDRFRSAMSTPVPAPRTVPAETPTR
jgi:H+/Cl- antiporter ClcA